MRNKAEVFHATRHVGDFHLRCTDSAAADFGSPGSPAGDKWLSRILIREPISRHVLRADLPWAYRAYLEVRIRFLLDRFRRFPDFSGVHTGYSALTGEEFPPEDLVSYSWINGRGAYVFARFAEAFPDYRDELLRFAHDVIEVMEPHVELNGGRFPFTVNPSETEKAVDRPFPTGFRSDSDQHACAGFLEYGVRANDSKRLDTAKRMLEECLEAVRENRFLSEPRSLPRDRIPHNPWPLDLANEFTKTLQDPAYLDIGEEMAQRLLDYHYFPEMNAFVEYVTPQGDAVTEEDGSCVVCPGHVAEFTAFALEFSRLAEEWGRKSKLQERINEVCPKLLLWNVDNGWNEKHGGMYLRIDAKTCRPLDDNMPWWCLPESMLALLLAYERTGSTVFLERYARLNNAYFTRWLNPRTSYGPFQMRDGKTGQPIDVMPACKFQDPEFHSGRSLLACIETMERI